jgi:isopenicillin-N N-acyltransferase-like protein
MLAGSAYEMGYRHGSAFRGAIRRYADERVALAGAPGWTGRRSTPAQVLELAEACVPHHRAFAPDLTEELEGMAAATGLSLAQLVVVGGFTDFVDTVAGGARGVLETKGVDDCTAFLVPGARMRDGVAALGQTWDMHEGSTEHLVLLRGRPADGPAFEVFTTAGAVGMIGMNEAGLTVGINNLMAADGRPGVTWPFVVRQILRTETLDEALAVLAGAHLAGGHNYLIMDGRGNGANVEAMGTRSHVTPLAERALAHTNHCLHEDTRAVERTRDAESQRDSEARLADAERLLDRFGMTITDLQAVTADTANICHAGQAPRFVGTCGGMVMRPGTRELWVVAGRPSQGAYQRYLAGEAAGV